MLLIILIIIGQSRKRKRMARYTQDHHDATHQAILVAASELVREHGFDGVSIGLVMKAVGLTHGGFYAHFPDKTALLTAAMTRALVPTVARFEDFVANAVTAEDPAQVAKTYLSDFHIAHPSKGCAAAALVSEVARQPLPVREAFAVGASASSAVLGQIFPPETGTKAWGVFALMSGALALMRAIPDPAQRAEIRETVMNDLRVLASATRT
jgi:TetR/AcrR family transcriptional regulator, transcriptional repressor for nem operon